MFLKLNDLDISKYTKGLVVEKEYKYNAQTNAAGNTVIDLINAKRTITATIIPLSTDIAAAIAQQTDNLVLSVSFLNPNTNLLEENVNCYIPSTEIEYLMILPEKKLTNEFELTFTEL